MKKAVIISLFIVALCLSFAQAFRISSFANQVQAKVDSDWDKSSLSFTGSCSGDCELVQATVCNGADSEDMDGPTTYEVYFAATGNPKNGSVVASGTVPALESGDCTTLTYDPNNVSGNYMFRALQRPGHPGAGDLWSSACEIGSCTEPTFICDSACTTDAQCQTANANYVCSDNKCRLSTNTTSEICEGPQECPAARECPTACGLSASEVPNGQCGVTQCPATNACEEETCEDRGDCEETTPTPTPTPTPSPSVGRESELSYSVPCEGDIVITLRLTDNHKPIVGTDVNFVYGPHNRKGTTDSDGRAVVLFGKAGEGTITANADGFSQRSVEVKFPTSCESTGIGGGQILGATTLAATGATPDLFAMMSILSGAVLTTASAYGYKRSKQN